jgi:hypothetical protein
MFLKADWSLADSALGRLRRLVVDVSAQQVLQLLLVLDGRNLDRPRAVEPAEQAGGNRALPDEPPVELLRTDVLSGQDRERHGQVVRPVHDRRPGQEHDALGPRCQVLDTLRCQATGVPQPLGLVEDQGAGIAVRLLPHPDLGVAQHRCRGFLVGELRQLLAIVRPERRRDDRRIRLAGRLGGSDRGQALARPEAMIDQQLRIVGVHPVPHALLLGLELDMGEEISLLGNDSMGPSAKRSAFHVTIMLS